MVPAPPGMAPFWLCLPTGRKLHLFFISIHASPTTNALKEPRFIRLMKNRTGLRPEQDLQQDPVSKTDKKWAIWLSHLGLRIWLYQASANFPVPRILFRLRCLGFFSKLLGTTVATTQVHYFLCLSAFSQTKFTELKLHSWALTSPVDAGVRLSELNSGFTAV